MNRLIISCILLFIGVIMHAGINQKEVQSYEGVLDLAQIIHGKLQKYDQYNGHKYEARFKI